MTDFYKNTLAKNTDTLLERIKTKKWLSNFYLAGGTALALQLGHRRSVDLDWFKKESINSKVLLKKVSQLGKFELLNEEKDTLEGLLDGVKVSFMTYPYSLLKSKLKYSRNIFLADKLDIAIMKLGAIAGRNSKKDFIDLYIFLQENQMDLDWLLGYLEKKFKGVGYDKYHIYKSLVYFAEADKEPMPKMFREISWVKVKKFFQREVIQSKK